MSRYQETIERQEKIDAYRKIVKAATGKMMTRAVAIEQLIDAALANVTLEKHGRDVVAGCIEICQESKEKKTT